MGPAVVAVDPRVQCLSGEENIFRNWRIDFFPIAHYVFVQYEQVFYKISTKKARSIKNLGCKEEYMSDFNVTDLAVSKLKEYMEQNNIDSALRVALMQGG